jgi:hypothetical protein
MKPAADSKRTHHLLEALLTALITSAVALLLFAVVWTVWSFVMGLAGENWPEWLRLCGVK